MNPFKRRRETVVDTKACPACGELLETHPQVDIASAPIGSKEEERLRQLIAEGSWPESRAYHAANADKDIRAWRMIRCRDGRIGVVSLVMPIEMWSNDYYEELRFLSDSERDALTATLGNAALQPITTSDQR